MPHPPWARRVRAGSSLCAAGAAAGTPRAAAAVDFQPALVCFPDGRGGEIQPLVLGRALGLAFADSGREPPAPQPSPLSERRVVSWLPSFSLPRLFMHDAAGNKMWNFARAGAAPPTGMDRPHPASLDEPANPRAAAAHSNRVRGAGRRGLKRLFCGPVLPLFVFAVLAVSSLARKSATYDEPVLLVSGAWYLHHFDPRVNLENPPLLKAFYALPSLFFSFDPAPPPARVFGSYDMHDGIEYGVGGVFAQPRALAILFACRIMAVLLALGLGGLLYRTARGHWGRNTALVLLWIYALSPNLIAHARWVTPDMGITLFFFATILFWIRFLDRGDWGNALLAGGCLAAALSSKYTGLLLLGILPLQALAAWVRQRGRSAGPWLRRRLGPAAAAAGLALVCLAAAYGFHGMFPTLAAFPARSPLLGALRRIPLLRSLPLPISELYLRGFDIVAWNNRPGFPAIFLGRVYPHGGSWPYYYLVVLALKSPLPLLIAWGAALLAWRRRPRSERGRSLLLWALPPFVVFLNFSLLAYRQLGLRYILPIWPFAILFLGYFVSEILRESRSAPTPAARIAAAALLLWYAGESLAIYPDYLSYFNELAGGCAGGWRYLAASNTDWGQDLPALARWQRRHGYPKTTVLYYGTAPPAAYGVRSVPWGRLPLPDYLAISVTNYYLYYATPLVAYLRIRGHPIARAGGSIHIFRLTPDLPERFFRDVRALAAPSAGSLRNPVFRNR